jgi:hypothetical protein
LIYRVQKKEYFLVSSSQLLSLTEQKTKDKDKFDFITQINEKWKQEQKPFDEAKVEGKDSWTGKKASGTWPRDMPQEQIQYEIWLKKVTDPDTGTYWKQRDKEGNIIKGTGPKHVIRRIVRFRTSDDKEVLWSSGYLIGFNDVGDPVSQSCQEPEVWRETGFAYKKEYDQAQGRVRSKVVGPNSITPVYSMEFNEANVKALFDKRITPEDLKLMGQKRPISLEFVVKDERNGVVRDVRDATGIPHKTLDLFLKHSFDYLANSEYITPQQKAEMRQQAIDMGLLPREAQQGEQIPAPPKGTYS